MRQKPATIGPSFFRKEFQELTGPDRPSELFYPYLFASLKKAIAADRYTIGLWNHASWRLKQIILPDDSPALSEGHLTSLQQWLYQHPLSQRIGNRGYPVGAPWAVRLSDLLSRKAFHHLELYQIYYRPVRTEYQMVTTLRHSPSLALVITMSRERRTSPSVKGRC
jgi:hypothetical protein